MMATRAVRCPSCVHTAVRQDGGPLLPGMLVVCAGCLAPSRFDEDYRLVLLGPGEIPAEHRATLARTVALLREQWGDRGCPSGYRWQTAPICRKCWMEVDTSEPPVVERNLRNALGQPSDAWAWCRLCQAPTSEGIIRRMLVKEGR